MAELTGASVLADRFDRARSDVRLLRTSLGRLSPGAVPTGVTLRLDRGLLDAASELARVSSTPGEEPRARWQELLRLEQEIATLSREYLAVLTRRRVAGADDGCRELDGYLELTDALLGEICARIPDCDPPTSTFAEREWYGEEARIVRIRFPETSVWALPVLVHELGHAAAPQLSRRRTRRGTSRTEYPFAALLDELVDTRLHWSHEHELIADAFATYLVGPSYLCVCALDRFSPLSPHEPSATHPSVLTRMSLVHAVLERMDQAGPASARAVAAIVADRWRRLVGEVNGLDAERLDEMEATARAAVAPKAGRYWEILSSTVPGEAYDDLSSAHAVKDHLAGHRAAPDGPGLRRRDVMNAAWLARLDRPADAATTGQIEKRARELCDRLAGPRGGDR